jgi:hypothetical protein
MAGYAMRPITAALAATVLTGSLVGAVAFAVNEPEVISACANSKTGAMRYLTSGECKSSETALEWNKQGPGGPGGFVLNDGNGATLGTIVSDVDQGYGWIVWDGSKFVSYSVAGNPVAGPNVYGSLVGFIDADCQGDEYLSANRPDNPYQLPRYVLEENADGTTAVSELVSIGPIETRTFLSYRNPAGECTNFGSGFTIGGTATVQRGAPYVPPALPLTVEVAP